MDFFSQFTFSNFLSATNLLITALLIVFIGALTWFLIKMLSYTSRDLKLIQRLKLIPQALGENSLGFFQKYCQRNDDGSFSCSYLKHKSYHRVSRLALRGSFVILLLKVALTILIIVFQEGYFQAFPGHLPITRIAPGEVLTISLEMTNIGRPDQATDVQVNYHLADKSGRIIYNNTETLAVLHSLIVVRDLPIPSSLLTGDYNLRIDLSYPGQTEPALSTFDITVEKKIFGFYYNQILAVLLTTLILSYLGYRMIDILNKRMSLTGAFSYLRVPKSKRIFFRIVGDIISQMSASLGSKAYLLASKVDGLQVDLGTGHVLDINKEPAYVISKLITAYELELGEKVKITSQKNETKSSHCICIPDIIDLKK